MWATSTAITMTGDMMLQTQKASNSSTGFLCGHLLVVGASATTSSSTWQLVDTVAAAKRRNPPGSTPGVYMRPGVFVERSSAPATLLRSLLLLAGDIHPNPGPAWPCSACSRNAARGSVLCTHATSGGTSRALESATVETYPRDGLVIPAASPLLLNLCLHLHLYRLFASQLYLLLLQSPHPI